MNGYAMARRSFLRRVAGAAGMAGLLRAIERSAHGAPPPTRFLVIHRPVGTVPEQWFPTGGSGPLTLSPILAPFAPLKSSLTVIDGLDIICVDGVAKGHQLGMVTVMTGRPMAGKLGINDYIASGPSIDQILLEQSPKLAGSAFGSVSLAADLRQDIDEVAARVLSYRKPPAPGQRAPIYPEMQPLEVYKRLFGSFMPGGDTTGSQLALERARARKQSVLDFLRSDLDRLGGLVPAGERVKIDAYGAAIRELEKSFDQALATGGGSGCTKPAAPKSFPQFSNQSGENPYHGEIGKLQLGIIRAAFACDLVRASTFMWSPGTNIVTFGGLYSGMPFNTHHPPSHDSSPASLARLAAIETWYTARTAEALAEFKTFTESDGGSLLDHTVVVWLSEVARGYDHDMFRAPVAVIGGARAGIAGDRLMKLSGRRPFNDLWLALAQKVYGVSLGSLGVSQQWSGPLPGLVA